MADNEKPARKPRIRKVETVRERVEKAETKPTRRRPVRATGRVVAKPFKAAARVGRKEYYPIKQSERNRFIHFMTKRRSWVLRYFKDAWKEMKQVVWPTRRQTWALTFAVYIFAIVFGTIVALTDFGLEKVFKRILLK